MTTRIGLVILSTLIGGAAGFLFGEGDASTLVSGGVMGGLVGGAILVIAHALLSLPWRSAVGGISGLTVGLLVAGLLFQLTNLAHATSLWVSLVGGLFLFLGFPYIGWVVGQRIGAEGWAAQNGASGQTKAGVCSLKLLDTSAIIDGRIADLCETGFIEGTLLVPQFILLELQHISDSSDGLKRARGRRGLDVLNAIQKMTNVKVEIIEDDFPHVKEVDTKLVELAKKLDAKIITNDLNLNKVAALQGVPVLNINELCNALKPVVLPGETIRVFVLKEGKEAGQGVAYLDDGTMVVVDNAKRLIGKNVEVVVTSVLQTSAGRMIFTRLREETEREELSLARV